MQAPKKTPEQGSEDPSARLAELEQALAEHQTNLNREIRPKEALLDINRAVQELTRPSHLQRVLQVCYDALHSVGLDFQGLAIHRLLNEAEATFESYQFRPSRKIEVMIRTVPNIKRMWQSGRASYRPDLQEDPGGMLPDMLKDLCDRYGMEIRCILDIPHPRGTLALLSTSPYAFSESEIQFVEQVSEVLSMGITRVEDLEQLASSQQDLAESRQHLELTLEAARVGVWDSNLTTGKLLWSDSVAPLFGLPPGTFPATREAFYECVHPDDRDLVQTAADQAIKDSSEFRVEHRVAHPDDTVLWMESKARVFHQKDGIHLRGTVMDITERKEAEEALIETDERLNLALLSSEVGTWDWEMEENEVIWDDYIQPLFGLEPGTFPGTYEAFMDLLHPEDRDRVSEEVRAAAEESAEYNTAYRVRWADGSIHHLSTRGKVYRNADGTPYRMTGVCWDITKQRTAEASLRKAHDELEQRVEERTAELQAYSEMLTQSNRALEDFAYVASHDLQEPLRKIQAFGDRLKTRYSDELGDRGQDYLDRMLNAAGRMRTLIADLLTLSRVTTKAQPFSSVDLNVVVKNVVSDLEVAIERAGGQVKVGDLPALEAEQMHMRQLFQNLIGNGLKFHQPEISPIVTIHSDSNGNRYRITVTDNGIGFDPKYTDRIFTPFQRLHNWSVYEGSGMGLAICRKIVEYHGGSITATSTPGQGATFTVTLPKKQPKP